MQIRLDQTITFTAVWKDSLGNPAAQPSGVVVVGVDMTKFSVTVLSDGVTYKVTPKATFSSPVTFGLGSPNAGATDSLTVVGGQAVSGTLVWGTPTPA